MCVDGSGESARKTCMRVHMPACAPLAALTCVCVFVRACVNSHTGSRRPCGRREWGAGSPARGSRRYAGRPSAATSAPCRRTTSPPAAASGSSSVPTPTVRVSVTAHSTHLHAHLQPGDSHSDTRLRLIVVTHLTNISLQYFIFLHSDFLSFNQLWKVMERGLSDLTCVAIIEK